MAFGAALSLIRPAVQTAAGIYQGIKAGQLKKRGPSKFIPQALKDNQALTKQFAFSSRNFDQGAEEANVRKTAANTTYNTTGSAGKRLSVAAGLGEKSASRYARIRERGRLNRGGRMDKYLEQNTKVAAQEKTNLDDHNRELSAMRGASFRNVAEGLMNFDEPLANVMGTMAAKKEQAGVTLGTTNPKIGGYDPIPMPSLDTGEVTRPQQRLRQDNRAQRKSDRSERKEARWNRGNKGTSVGKGMGYGGYQGYVPFRTGYDAKNYDNWYGGPQ